MKTGGRKRLHMRDNVWLGARSLLWRGALTLNGVRATLGARGSGRARLIPMHDVTPAGFRLDRFWHGIGMDRDKRVYAAISTGAELRGEPGDVFLFRYDTATGDREFLRSVRQTLAEEGNLGPNAHWPKDESVAKVHSDILEHDGRLYFSTHDLHSPDGLETHRGGHFLSFDPATGCFRDLSKTESLGVSVVNEGIIAMNILRGEDKLVGWTYPYGNVLIHDLRSGTTTLYRSGLERDRVADVARVVIATRSGQIFAAYRRDSALAGSDRLYKLDRGGGRLQPTDERFSCTGRFEGLAETSDGRTIYLADWDGELFAFDVERERLEALGSILPDERVAAGGVVRQLYNLALSPDDRKLFTLPCLMERGKGAYHLYEYDIETATKTDLGYCGPMLWGSTPTGNGVFDDRGRYYLSGYWGRTGRVGILQVNVGDRLV